MPRTIFSSVLLFVTLAGVHQWLQASSAPLRGVRMYNQPAGPYIEPEWYERQQRIADAKEAQRNETLREETQRDETLRDDTLRSEGGKPSQNEAKAQPRRATSIQPANTPSSTRALPIPATPSETPESNDAQSSPIPKGTAEQHESVQRQTPAATAFSSAGASLPSNPFLLDQQPQTADVQPPVARQTVVLEQNLSSEFRRPRKKPTLRNGVGDWSSNVDVDAPIPPRELAASPNDLAALSSPDQQAPFVNRDERILSPSAAKRISQSMRDSLRALLKAAHEPQPSETPRQIDTDSQDLSDSQPQSDPQPSANDEAEFDSAPSTLKPLSPESPLALESTPSREAKTTTATDDSSAASSIPRISPQSEENSQPNHSHRDNASPKPFLPETSLDESSPLEAGPSNGASGEEASPNSVQDLSPSLVRLGGDLRRTLAHYFQDRENSRTRSPWGVMHSMLPFGVDSQIVVDGRLVNTLGWLCWNGECRGQQLLYLEGGRLMTRQGPGVQGHRGQFLAMLAQSKVKSDFELRVQGERFTVDDLVRYEMQTCQPDSELTFKLIGLSHYLDSEAEWITPSGEHWSLRRMLDEELKQDVNGAACGGSHRLMGLAYALNRRRKRNEPIVDQWRQAADRVEQYQTRIAEMRNPDGSFSTNWFAARGAEEDIDRRMQTTGHILEWMVFSLPREELTKPEIVQSVRYLNEMMWVRRDYDWAVGPKGHAIRAISLYDERVFGAQPGKRRSQLTEIIKRFR